MLSHLFHRITEKTENVHAAPVLIIAFGDSVTQGCMEIDVIDHVHVYHQILKSKLEVRYPSCTFSVLNAGCSGETSADALIRLDRDLLRHDPDLVVLGFCLNDACGGTEKLETYGQNLSRMIASVRAGTSADIILLTPNFMASYDNGKIASVHRPLAGTIIDCQNQGILERYVRMLRKVAAEQRVAVADIHEEWARMASSGLDTTSFLVNGLNHPDQARQRLIADKVFELICHYDNKLNGDVC